MKINADSRPHPSKPGGRKAAEEGQKGKVDPRFEKLDANQDGTLSGKELLERGAARFAARDANGDGKVSRKESRMDFKLLDADGDGKLNEAEAQGFGRYGKDEDGSVSKEEFLQGQRADRATAREAIRNHTFDQLDADGNGKLGKREGRELEGYDANDDGKVTREEFHAGRGADWKAKRDERFEGRFDALDRNGDGVLSRKEGKEFRGYDLDGDRRVSRLEFHNGQEADRKAEVFGGILGETIKADYQAEAANGLEEPTLPQSAKGPTDLVISSFNVLGSSHTTPGGEKPGMDSGVTRIRRAAKLLNEHKVDVVGFQELQSDQLREFKKVAGDKFGVYPGEKLPGQANANSIAWRKDKWDLVKADSIAIPYFGGHKVDMPVVLLRNKETGQEAYFTNFHNPASTRKHPDQEKWRDKATDLEIDLVNRLRKSGKPVFLTGDMNEREEYFNRMSKGTDMNAANEGRDGRPRQMGIDWIFGSSDVSFSGYVKDQGKLVRDTSDHPMIVSKARIHGD